jgi:hypothetical protein
MMEELKQELLNDVISEITEAIRYADHEALEELLNFVPVTNLIEYLPEEVWDKYKPLRNESN